MLKYYLKIAFIKAKNSPLSYVLMVFALALGIGVSMTMITLNYLMAQDPIPEKSHRLHHVQLYSYGKGHTNRFSPDGFPYQLTYTDINNIHRSDIPVKKTRSVSTGFSVKAEDPSVRPFMANARAVDSDFFGLFNAPFLYGAPWPKAVDESAQKQVVLTKALNDKLFKGENSIGNTTSFNNETFTIVGVLDAWEPTPHFYDLNNQHFGETESAFVPFALVPVMQLPSWGNNNGWKSEQVNSYEDKLRSEVMWLQYWVELANNEQIASYQDFLEGYIAEQKKLGRFTNEKAAASLKNVNEWLAYNEVIDKDTTILLIISFLFLAVCIINAVTMLLSKFLQRAPEVGVRRALGASRRQIFYQHIVDVSLIGLGGCVLGLLIGQLGLLAVKALYPDYRQLVEMDLTLIIFAVVLSLASSFLSGLYPAWKICRTNPSLYLKLQ